MELLYQENQIFLMNIKLSIEYFYPLKILKKTRKLFKRYMNHSYVLFYEYVEILADMFKVKGDIFPIVNESVVLHAEMTDGTIVSGESNIPHEHKIINRIFLTPENIEPNPKVVQAIHEADLVIISPGS